MTYYWPAPYTLHYTGDEKYPIWKAVLVCQLDKSKNVFKKFLRSKNVFKKFLRFHRLVKIPICIQVVANGPAGLPNWWFNTNKNSILGYDILGFSSPNSLLRVMGCMIDVIDIHQFIFQITISTNLNVDSRLVSWGAMCDAPNWALIYIPDLEKLDLLVLYFNKNTDAFRGCWFQVPLLYTSVNNNMTDVIKDAFLMMMCPHPVGFLLTGCCPILGVPGYHCWLPSHCGLVHIVTVALFTGSRSSLLLASCLLSPGSCRSLDEPSSLLLISPALVAALVLMIVNSMPP